MTETIMDMPCISIIIPVYNTKKYLAKCLDSVCGQTYKNLEIIVINDGSTDGSEIFLQKYAKSDERIQLITQKNQGLSSARNEGLNSSSGEYVMFLDSDDWIEKDTCNLAIKTIIDTEADVVLWSYIKEYASSTRKVYPLGEKKCIWDEITIKKLYKQMIGPQGEELREAHKVDSFITAWGKLYRRSCIGELRFIDTKLIGTEDALFNIQFFSKVKRAVYLPATFSHYRKTNLNSLTRKYKYQLVNQWQELYRRIKEQLNIENAPLGYYQALNNRIAFGLIGLGLNLAEDDQLNLKRKCMELKRILRMPHYRVALENLELKYLPIYWKVFFSCAKCNGAFGLMILLMIMNQIRG